MPTTLSLAEAHALVTGILAANGCGDRQARVVAEAVVAAERDGATSHGFFRLPGYVTDLAIGWVDGRAEPVVEDAAPGLRGLEQMGLVELDIDAPPSRTRRTRARPTSGRCGQQACRSRVTRLRRRHASPFAEDQGIAMNSSEEDAKAIYGWPH